MELVGKIARVIFKNEESNYYILSLMDKSVVKGTMFEEPKQGTEYIFHGEYKKGKNDQTDFCFDYYERYIQNTTDGMAAYLCEIPGVGKKTAKSIVDTLGLDCLRIIRDFGVPSLMVIPKFKEKQAEKIVAYCVEKFQYENQYTALHSLGLTPNQITKIIREYKEEAVSIVQNNPYQMITQITGIGFNLADTIAAKAGLEPESPHRIRAAVFHVMRESTYSGGNAYIYANDLVEQTITLLKNGVEVHQAQSQLFDPDYNTSVRQQIVELIDKKAIIYEENRVYLKALYEAEQKIARHIRRLMAAPKKRVSSEKILETLAKLEQRLGVKYADQQREAIQLAPNSNVLVLTGGPGTGKTTTVLGIVEILKELQGNVSIALAAPTGRAAKRMTESTNMEAKTVHRLLEYGFVEGDRSFGFNRNEENQLEQDIFVFDEASMLDTLITADLLSAIPTGATVLFVGDINQIPSVGAGQTLRDLIGSQTVPVVMLNVIYRQSGQSGIVLAAQHILEGRKMDNVEYPDFRIIKKEEAEQVRDYIVHGMKVWLVDRKMDPMQIQVLAPMYRGPAGIASLNVAIQENVNPSNPSKPEWKIGDRIYRVGDKVMQTRNNIDKDVFNGDCGIITDIYFKKAEDEDEDSENKERVMVVNMNGRHIEYTKEELDSLTLAYAISIHKSQGSEYNYCLIPMVSSFYMMLYRNLYYTAITRAKKCCVTIGQMKAINMAVRRIDTTQRNTTLAQRLRGA